VYPWSSPPTSTLIDATHAAYNGAAVASFVGSRSPAGDGRWGHADLAGNAAEWTLDLYASPYVSNTCKDCANLDQDQGAGRAVRGGAYYNADVSSGQRGAMKPTVLSSGVGARCARPL
jgi:formylglycine-generating enzyme required for sulfatase activity